MDEPKYGFSNSDKPMFVRTDEVFGVKINFHSIPASKILRVEAFVRQTNHAGRIDLAFKVLEFIPKRYVEKAWANESGNICIEFIDSGVGRTVIEVMNSNQLIVHDQWHHKGASQIRTVIEWE